MKWAFNWLIEGPTGRDAEIRTRDLTHPKGARYQAAPRPVIFQSIATKHA